MRNYKKLFNLITLIFILVATTSVYSQDTYKQLKVKKYKKINANTTVYFTKNMGVDDTGLVNNILYYYKKLKLLRWGKIVFDFNLTNTPMEFNMYVYDEVALYNRDAFNIENQMHETLNGMEYGGMFGDIIIPFMHKNGAVDNIAFLIQLAEQCPKKFYTIRKRISNDSDEKINDEIKELKNMKMPLAINFGLIDKENFVLYETDLIKHKMFYKWIKHNKIY